MGPAHLVESEGFQKSFGFRRGERRRALRLLLAGGGLATDGAEACPDRVEDEGELALGAFTILVASRQLEFRGTVHGKTSVAP